MAKIQVISDGTRDGTKVLIDGLPMANEHWEKLSWEYDYLAERWTINIKYFIGAGFFDVKTIEDKGQQLAVKLEMEDSDG